MNPRRATFDFPSGRLPRGRAHPLRNRVGMMHLSGDGNVQNLNPCSGIEIGGVEEVRPHLATLLRGLSSPARRGGEVSVRRQSDRPRRRVRLSMALNRQILLCYYRGDRHAHPNGRSATRWSAFDLELATE
jgi:hypothetical protein